jgi:hypothetical protein
VALRDVIRANRGRAAAPLICPVRKATLPPAWCSALPRSQRVPVVVVVGWAWRRLGGLSALVCPPRREIALCLCCADIPLQLFYTTHSQLAHSPAPQPPHHDTHLTMALKRINKELTDLGRYVDFLAAAPASARMPTVGCGVARA